jgi:hypothetical protein
MKQPIHIVSFLVLLGFSQILLAQKLVAWYPFNNSVFDISGNQNNGKINGGVKATTDRFGNPCGAMNFNGLDGFVEVPSSNSLESINKLFSVSCWFKISMVPSAGGFRWLTIICKGDELTETDNNPQFRMQTFQSTIQSTISINTDFTEYDNDFSKHFLQYDKWNFYVLVYDGTNVRCYLNNNKIWEFPYTKSFSPNKAPLHIGKDIPGSIEYFNGSLDDLRIFEDALTENEISKLYNDKTNAKFDNEFSLKCPANITSNTEKDQCFATVLFPEPELNLNCGSATLTQISGLSSGSEFPVGINNIIYEAKGTRGDKQTCTLKVIVNDINPPVFRTVSDVNLVISNQEGTSKVYNYDLPVAIDNCSEVIVKLVSGIPSGGSFPIGSSDLRFLATDKAGNRTELIYSVHVDKGNSNLAISERDSLKCPDDIRKFNDSKKCGAIVNFSIGDSDFKQEEGMESGSFFSVGTTRNTLGRLISGSSQTKCSFSVQVIDNEKPELVCPNDVILYTEKAASPLKFNYAKPIANDNCQVESLLQLSGLASDAIYPIGSTQNVFKATDASGNFSICSFNVIVLDTFKKAVKDRYAAIQFRPDLFSDTVKYENSALDFDACTITLVMYDDSKQDFDTVSVFHNDQEIVSRELIRLRHNGPIIRVLKLKEGGDNEFIVKAWNTGQIYPNTMRIDFYLGDYLARTTSLKTKQPFLVKTFHSVPGAAAGIYLKCKNK